MNNYNDTGCVVMGNKIITRFDNITSKTPREFEDTKKIMVFNKTKNIMTVYVFNGSTWSAEGRYGVQQGQDIQTCDVVKHVMEMKDIIGFA
jgi:hypothetical protein